MLENQRGLTPTSMTELDGCLCGYVGSTESEEYLFYNDREKQYCIESKAGQHGEYGRESTWLTPTSMTKSDGCLCEYFGSTEQEECLFHLTEYSNAILKLH